MVSGQEKIVLGVDPGFICAGFGVVRVQGRSLSLLESGALRQQSSQSLSERVGAFYDFFQEKIGMHHVTCIALETPFLGKNAQNFLKLGYLRGILYLLQHRYKLDIAEFSPMLVKRTITGYGGAQKEQVARVLLRLFPGLVMPERFDITDAIAVSVCGAWVGGEQGVTFR